MSYQQSPALTKHALDSILPYEIKLYQAKQIPKNRQFYRPQQFIWNNPHRASDTIYKFYHKYNEVYDKNKAPILSKLEKKQREQTNINRIKKLNQIRQDTRQRFFTRQKQRQNLELLSGTRQKTLESQYLTAVSATKRFSTVSQYHPKPSKNDPMIPSYLPSKIPHRKSDVLLRNIEQAYITGVQKADSKRKLIENMIVSQTHLHQNELREQFEKQKQLNSRRMSQVSKIEVSKLETKSLYKQY